MPSTIGMLSKLNVLDLESNMLSSTIPSMKPVRYLQHLRLGHNKLSSPLFPALSHQAELLELNVTHNEMSGDVLFFKCFLACCVSAGKNPWTNLRLLAVIDLSFNQFTGEVNSLGYILRPRVLDISSNFFVGEVPSSLPNALVTFNASNNQLSGTMPTDAFERRMDELETIDVSGNQIVGALPMGVAEIGALKTLILANNSFTGTVHSEWSEMSSLSECWLILLSIVESSSLHMALLTLQVYFFEIVVFSLSLY